MKYLESKYLNTLNNEELFKKVKRVQDVHEMVLFIKSVNTITQIRLAIMVYNNARTKAATLDSPVIKTYYHPIEEEIVKALACKITLQEFIAERRCIDGNTNPATLTKRWNKIAYLLQVYTAYADYTDLTLTIKNNQRSQEDGN